MLSPERFGKNGPKKIKEDLSLGRMAFRAVFGYRPEPVTLKEGKEDITSLDQVTNAEEFLGALDFELINSLFDTLQEKSGLETEHRARISRDDITLRDKFKIHDLVVAGSLQPASLVSERREVGPRGVITGAWATAKISAYAYNIPVWQAALKTVIHESAHFISFQKEATSSKEQKDREWNDTIKNFDQIPAGTLTDFSKIGFQELKEVKERDESMMPKFTIFGKAFNEAVTEKLALEVTQEYMRSKGLKEVQGTDPNGKEIPTGSYPGERKMLEAVIVSISNALEVSREQVWRAIIREYFSGEEGLEKFSNHIAEALMQTHTATNAEAHRRKDKVARTQKFLRDLWTWKSETDKYTKEEEEAVVQQITEAIATMDTKTARNIALNLGL